MTGGTDPSALAIITVDSPQLILAVDPLASLLEFAVSPFTKHVDVEQQPQESAEQADEFEEGPKQGASLSFRVEVVKATVIVIADDTNPKTQAIQLNIREILLSQQSILALKIDRIGMSFGRMDRPNDRVKFLDDLSMALSLDTRRKGSQQMTSFEVVIPDPVIFRASYTNIMLIIDIVNKATTVAAKALAPVEGTGRAEKDSKPLRKGSASSAAVMDPRHSRRRSSVIRRTSVSKRRRSIEGVQIIISKEQVSNDSVTFN